MHFYRSKSIHGVLQVAPPVAYCHSYGYRVAICIFTENATSPRGLKHLHTVYQVGMYIGPYAPGGATYHISRLISVIPDNDIFI